MRNYNSSEHGVNPGAGVGLMGIELTLASLSKANSYSGITMRRSHAFARVYLVKDNPSGSSHRNEAE